MIKKHEEVHSVKEPVIALKDKPKVSLPHFHIEERGLSEEKEQLGLLSPRSIKLRHNPLTHREELLKEQQIDLILLNQYDRQLREGLTSERQYNREEAKSSFEDSSRSDKIAELKRRLAKLQEDYAIMLKLGFNSEESFSLDDQIEELNRELDESLKTKERLSRRLREIHQQVNLYWIKISETKSILSQFLKKKIIHRSASDINAMVALKESEESNLRGITNILKRDTENCQAIIDFYSNPKELQGKEAALVSISKRIEELESKLVSLKRCYESHSKCAVNEEKLLNLLQVLRQEHFDHRGKEVNEPIGRTVSRNIPLNLKYRLRSARKNQSIFEDYSKLYQTKDERTLRYQKKIKADYPKLNLFRPEEFDVLKEVIPIDHLIRFTKKYKSVDDIAKKIKVQSSQEMEYYKHTNEKIIQAYHENKTQLDLEKKKTSVLMNDRKREMINISNVNQRIKELDKVLQSTHKALHLKDQANNELKEAISLLSFDIQSAKLCPKC